MPRYADVDKMMKHAIKLDWSILKWVNEVDICTAINPRVVERKRGKWIACGWSLKCSECGYDMPFAVRNYCPNCGADMREETKDE